MYATLSILAKRLSTMSPNSCDVTAVSVRERSSTSMSSIISLSFLVSISRLMVARIKPTSSLLRSNRCLVPSDLMTSIGSSHRSNVVKR